MHRYHNLILLYVESVSEADMVFTPVLALPWEAANVRSKTGEGYDGTILDQELINSLPGRVRKGP